MSRTLKELTAGQSVYVDTLSGGETVSTEFIYLGESDDGAAGLLLWASPRLTRQMHSSNVAEYQTSDMRAFLISSDGGFLDTYLPTEVQNCLVSSQYCYYSVDNETLIYLTDPVRLLTYEECGYAITNGEGTSRLEALEVWADTLRQIRRELLIMKLAPPWAGGCVLRILLLSSATCTLTVARAATVRLTRARRVRFYRSIYRQSCPTKRRTQYIYTQMQRKPIGRSIS